MITGRDENLLDETSVRILSADTGITTECLITNSPSPPSFPPMTVSTVSTVFSPWSSTPVMPTLTTLLQSVESIAKVAKAGDDITLHEAEVTD